MRILSDFAMIRRLLPALLVGTLLFPPVASIGALLRSGMAFAQTVPGGFIEKASNTTARPRPTATEIQSFLPSTRGKFTFPAPYNTEGIRITLPSDCGGTDCVNYVGYAYWRNINNHAGSDTMLMFLRLRGFGGATLFSYNKVTDEVRNLGPLFEASSPFAQRTGEGWYFSASLPTKLYVSSGSRLFRYDVYARTFETVFDAATHFGAGRSIGQTHSSDDDRVHSATLRDGSGILGCMVYREDTGQFSLYSRIGSFDECQIDKHGRWLVIKENVDGVAAEDNRIIDLQTGIERVLLDQDGAAGHSDMGDGYMVAHDNHANIPHSVKLWQFAANPFQGVLVTHSTWTAPAANHIAHSNRKTGVPPAQQYACGSHASASTAARANEIICFRLDNSLDVLVVAPVMTDMNTPGGGDSYSKLPKGNIDVTGQYFIWTSNMGGNRLDAFLVKIPAHHLVAADTTPPTVVITAPGSGATVTGTVTVAANASDNVAVAGVRFKLDGADLGAEITVPPYAIAWDSTTASSGNHTLTAVARDAGGNTSQSAAVNVTISNADTIPPSLSDIRLSSVGPTSAALTWTTNEPSTTQVEYGLTAAYGTLSPLNVSLVTAHAQTMNGLTPGTLYHYRVRSADAAGNLAVSGDFTFTTSQPVTLDTGLVGYWQFSEGTGLIAGDSSGTGNSGTLLNGPAWVAIIPNPALSFDGVDDYVNVPHAAALNAYPLTVSVWLRTNSTAGVRGIVNKYVASSYNGWNIFLNNGNLCAWYLRTTSSYVYGGGGCTFNLSGYNDNQWHHVVYVVDAAGGRLYVDGVQRGSLGWTGLPGAPSTTQPVHVGHYPGASGGAEYFQGVLDELRIYNRALSAEEISTLFTTFSPGVDTASPQISSVSALEISSVGATITWMTDEPSDSRVEYGPTAAYGSVLDVAGLVATHTVTLQNLAPGTLHHYRVRSQDASGNVAISEDQVFTTSGADTLLPTVSVTAPAPAATVSGIVTVSANASDDVGIVGVQFRLDGAGLGNEDTEPPYAIAWDTGTIANGTHILSAVARDAAGNLGVAADVTITVANDTTGPVLSGISASATSSESTVTWTTDEPSTSQVEYGPTTAYGSVSTLDAALITGHSITLSNLSSGTLYHYRVMSRDALGNLTASSDQTFTTAFVPDLVVHRAPASVTVDGDLSEWAGATGVTFNGRSNTVTASLMWNATYLYVAFTVTDNVFSVFQTARDASSLYQDDGVEIYVDSLGDRTPTMQADDYQFLLNLLNIQGDLRGTGTGKESAWNASWSSAVRQQAIKQGNTHAGYVIEVAIPWAQIGVSAAPGLMLGMNLAVNDRDETAFDFFDWARIAPASYAQPALWKRIQLVDVPSTP